MYKHIYYYICIYIYHNNIICIYIHAYIYILLYMYIFIDRLGIFLFPSAKIFSKFMRGLLKISEIVEPW